MVKLTRRLMNDKEHQRFIAKVDKQTENATDYLGNELDPCWIWTAALGGAGKYPQFSIERAPIRATEASYRYYIGDFDRDKYQLDHLCRVKECVNPYHLEPVTPSENQRRIRESKDRCKRGHPITEKNTYVDPRGWRECLDCRRENVRKSRGKPKMSGIKLLGGGLPDDAVIGGDA